MPQLDIDKVWGDAWAVYKLLLRRSVITAALVYAVADAPDALADVIEPRWAEILLRILGFVLVLAGPVIVQGSLVEILRNVHEGERPKPIRELYASAWQRVGSLFWASIVYGFGVVFGLLLLIVPGLLAASRWCLMAPLIVLEGDDAGEARARSRALVTPQTWSVFGSVATAFLATSAVGGGATSYVEWGDPPALLAWVISVVASALVAPFTAHVLTVLYYRITDPERPVIHPDVLRWRSVWAGA